MSRTASVNPELRIRLGRALERLADAIQREIPVLRFAIEYGSNDSFPWWVVARFANASNETKVVDVSIDCHVTPQGWRIRADVARGDGAVIQELQDLPAQASFNGGPPAATAEALARVEGFLSQQADEIARELA